MKALLDDKVLTGEGEKINKNIFGFGGEFVGQPRITLDDDQLTKAYVEINGEQINVKQHKWIHKSKNYTKITS